MGHSIPEIQMFPHSLILARAHMSLRILSDKSYLSLHKGCPWGWAVIGTGIFLDERLLWTPQNTLGSDPSDLGLVLRLWQGSVPANGLFHTRSPGSVSELRIQWLWDGAKESEGPAVSQVALVLFIPAAGRDGLGPGWWVRTGRVYLPKNSLRAAKIPPTFVQRTWIKLMVTTIGRMVVTSVTSSVFHVALGRGEHTISG